MPYSQEVHDAARAIAQLLAERKRYLWEPLVGPEIAHVLATEAVLHALAGAVHQVKEIAADPAEVNALVRERVAEVTQPGAKFTVVKAPDC